MTSWLYELGAFFFFIAFHSENECLMQKALFPTRGDETRQVVEYFYYFIFYLRLVCVVAK